MIAAGWVNSLPPVQTRTCILWTSAARQAFLAEIRWRRDMDDDHRELLRRLFTAVTARIETAHEAAVAGQSGEIARGDYAAAARRLQEAARDIAALAEAALVITTDRLDDAGFDHVENSS